MESKQETWTLWSDDRINEEQSQVLKGIAAELAIPLTEEGRRDVNTLLEAFLGRNDAVGLAAPQIGMGKRIVVFRTKNFSGGEPLQKNSNDYELLVNPRITQYRGDEEQDSEGCLSCPHITADVARWTEIKVRAFDEKGNKISRRYTGYLARVVQHELDHLDGTLIVDRASTLYYPREKKLFFDSLFRNDTPPPIPGTTIPPGKP